MGILRSLQRRSARGAWTKLVQSPGFPPDLVQPIADVLLPRHVSPFLFIDNYQFLERGGLVSPIQNPFEEQRRLSVSRSIGEFARRTDRPSVYAVWFLAAFPDVASWLSGLIEQAHRAEGSEESEVLQQFHDSLGVDDPSELCGPDGKCNTKYANAMVELFLNRTGRQPECCI